MTHSLRLLPALRPLQLLHLRLLAQGVCSVPIAVKMMTMTVSSAANLRQRPTKLRNQRPVVILEVFSEIPTAMTGEVGVCSIHQTLETEGRNQPSRGAVSLTKISNSIITKSSKVKNFKKCV